MHKLGQLPIKLVRYYKVWYIAISKIDNTTSKQPKCIIYILARPYLINYIKQIVIYICIIAERSCMLWMGLWGVIAWLSYNKHLSRQQTKCHVIILVIKPLKPRLQLSKTKHNINVLLATWPRNCMKLLVDSWVVKWHGHL